VTPLSASDAMGTAALARSRTRAITDRLREVNASLKSLNAHHVEGRAGGSGADADVAQDHAQAEEIAAERSRLILEARALTGALGRIAEGSYGVCACGESIPETRLIAVSTTEHCISCATALERDAARGVVA
jgi:RNA polymerase-binding transcription factor DksA